MPTYEYACTVCAERHEVVQRITDPSLTECPACGGALRKVFSPVGVVFKGSGFYKTDSRGKSSAGSSSSSSSESSSGGTSSSGAAGSDSSGSSSSSSGSSSSGSGPAAPAASSSTGKDAAAG